MTNLININFNSERPTVDGRELYQALGVKTGYKDWFPRICEYGFEEGRDFSSFLRESTGGRPSINHNLSLSMAKEICMLQRSDIGKKFRQYFIEIEEQWNTPEAVYARALQMANRKLDSLKNENELLLESVAIKEQQILEMKPKASYYDVVLNCEDALPITIIAKDYGMSAKKMNSLLHDLKIQFKQGNVWVLYQKYAKYGYTNTKTHPYIDSAGVSRSKVHTYWTQQGRLFIYDLLKREGILPNVEKE